MRSRFLSATTLAALNVFCLAGAGAQASSNAVTGAEDAFGFTSGEESIGIYDQSSVRGFNLEAAGNYRVNGTYFVKNSGVSSTFLESTAVKIGYATLAASLPGPSGVVDFKLRDPAHGEPSLVTLGLGEFNETYMDILYKHRASDNRLSLALGANFVFDKSDLQGGGGSSWLVGGTSRISIGSQSVLRVFGGEYDYRRDSQFRIVNVGDELPHRIERRRFLGQEWARERGQRRIAGALFDSTPAGRWSVGGTLVFSQEDPTRAYRQLFVVDGDSEMATSRIVAAPQQRQTSWSGEIRGRWSAETASLRHSVELSLRGRRSRNLFGGDRVLGIGEVLLGAKPAQMAAPDTSDARADLRTAVDQWGAGAAYRLAWRDRFLLNAGLLKSRYIKRFTPAGGVSERGRSAPWLYNLGGAARAGGGIELYASYSRGLEESGIAPASAANRNAVLDAIIVTQREIGLKYDLAPGLKAVIAGFDTRKPYAGIDSQTNIYRFLGDVRHRGIEASLSGRPIKGTSIVAGGVFLQPRLSGAQVDAGIIGDRPVGVPQWRLIGSIDQDIAAVEGLSLDLAGEYVGRQAARTRIALPEGKQMEIAPSVTFDLGARYRFRALDNGFTVRLQALNIFNDYAWTVDPSEALGYSPSRRFRLVLTAEL
ncbi:MAG: TonB-dependent receptor [Sphingosinicella sp.]|nr:TonB-dependent receptor [Sphingosinicella sp.]